MANKMTASEVINGLEDLNLADLKEVYSATQRQIEKTKKAARAEALQRMRQVADETGVDFDALMKEHYGIDEGKSASDKRKTKAAPKYMHPENSALTWSGRGRQPGWIKEYREKGGDIDDFLIEKKTEVEQ